MKKGKRMAKGLLVMPALIFLIILGTAAFSSCAGQKTSEKAQEAEANIDDNTFYESQPVKSGLYDATYFDITGTNDRKGQFDGRIYFSLAPEMSAIKVFENGNRTKIDCTITLQKPFEKGDSGIYKTVDKKDRPVIVNTSDSANYTLDFQYSGNDYKITFSPKARYEASAMEILEKITSGK